MTLAKWYTPGHVALAAVRACAANLAAYAAANWSGDPFLTTPLPGTPTTYSPTGVPNDGDFYMRENAAPDGSRPIPFVEFWVDGQPSPSEDTDSEATIYAVRIGIRVRVGSNAGVAVEDPPSVTSTAAAIASLHNQAISLCRLAQIVTSEYLRSAGLIYDPTGALGICWNNILSPPAVDSGSPTPADGNGTVTADAVAFIEVYQRMFVPAGIGATSL